jgi:hypothetical protein
MASHRDPRVPGLTYRRNVLKEEELPVDGYAILSILFGFLGFASKVRCSVWCWWVDGRMAGSKRRQYRRLS